MRLVECLKTDTHTHTLTYLVCSVNTFNSLLLPLTAYCWNRYRLLASAKIELCAGNGSNWPACTPGEFGEQKMLKQKKRFMMAHCLVCGGSVCQTRMLLIFSINTSLVLLWLLFLLIMPQHSRSICFNILIIYFILLSLHFIIYHYNISTPIASPSAWLTC